MAFRLVETRRQTELAETS